MTNQLAEQTLGDFNPDNVGAPKRESSVIRIPTDENTPLVFKLLVHPSRPNDAYYPVFYHRHLIGPNQNKDGRNHLCHKMRKEACPECDKFWEIIGQMSAMKKNNTAYTTDTSGKQVPTPQYQRLKDEKDLYRQSTRYWLLVLPLGSDQPKALQVPQAVIDIIFGKEERDGKVTTGLYARMRKDGRNPFNIKAQDGWLKLFRSGEPPRVNFNLTEATMKEEMTNKNGHKIEVDVPLLHAVPDTVLGLKKDNLPDVTQLDNYESMVWTVQESMNFVNSDATIVPDRCKKKAFNESRSSSETTSRTGELPAFDTGMGSFNDTLDNIL